MDVRVLLLEDLCNRSPNFGALVIREETPSPLPVGCPKYGLLELPQEHGLVVTPGHGFVLLLAAGGGPALLVSPFCLGVPYQARVLAPLSEVHPPHDPDPDIPGLADAHVTANSMLEHGRPQDIMCRRKRGDKNDIVARFIIWRSAWVT